MLLVGFSVAFFLFKDLLLDHAVGSSTYHPSFQHLLNTRLHQATVHVLPSEKRLQQEATSSSNRETPPPQKKNAVVSPIV